MRVQWAIFDEIHVPVIGAPLQPGSHNEIYGGELTEAVREVWRTEDHTEAKVTTSDA